MVRMGGVQGEGEKGRTEQILDNLDGRSIHMRDEIAELDTTVSTEGGGDQTRRRRRASLDNLDDEHPRLERPSQLPLERALDTLLRHVDTQRGSDDASVSDDLVDDASHGVNGDGEPDADVPSSAARREDGGVDADEPAARVEEWTARVAWIDRRVRLDAPLDGPPSDAVHVAAERRDDAHRQRVVEPERVADREHILANLRRERPEGETGGRDRSRDGGRDVPAKQPLIAPRISR